jgi:hypothetical protein
MVSLARDGSTWRIGTDAEVAWIIEGTSIGLTITAAIPPVFEAYATVVLPFAGRGQDDHDRTCIGGPAGLVDSFLRHPDLSARPVDLGQDATPPGHQAL